MLVDDHDFVVADDVVLVLGEQLLCLDGVVQVADELGVFRGVEVVDAELVLDELHSLLTHTDGLLATVDLVVDVEGHLRDDAGEGGEPLGGAADRTGDDQRGAGLIDEDRVDLIDDGEVVAVFLTLHQVVEGVRHVVAQVVEAELVVRAVGDVGIVGVAALRRLLAGEDHVGAQTEEAVDTAHPLRVTLGEVVVDGDYVDAPARQGVEVGGEHTGQGLSLTGLHLGDISPVQGGTAHDLHLVVLLAEDAPGRLTGGGEGVEQDVVESLPGLETLLEFLRLRLQLSITESGVLVILGDDLVCDGGQPLDGPSLAESENLRKS
jgi:hypothetical protein